MNYQILLFALISVILGVSAQNRIVGGDRVTNRKQYPYQISLRLSGQHICGGTIYKPRIVITAAHCLKGMKASQLEVVAGDLNLRNPTSHTQRIQAEGIYIHENYSDVVLNDVGVIKLKKSFTYDDYVRNITIWNETLSGSPTAPGVNCVVSGWGATQYEGSVVSDLRYVNINVFTGVRCSSIYGNNFQSPGMICAGDFSESKDSCSGDSGGPLVCNGQLYGIVSWGVDCGKPHFPGVYTNASYYQNWIDTSADVDQAYFLQKILLFLGCIITTKTFFY